MGSAILFFDSVFLACLLFLFWDGRSGIYISIPLKVWVVEQLFLRVLCFHEVHEAAFIASEPG